MFRVIRSTTQGIDIDPERADEWEEAAEGPTAYTYRETYRESDGQKDSHYRLISYTDPDGQNRWAFLIDEPAESDWQDTDDLAEALAAYEEGVRETAEGIADEYETVEDDETGEQVERLRDPFTFTDVPAVPGYEDEAEETGNGQAWMQEAQWKAEAADKAQAAAQAAAEAKHRAFARALEAWGRGGQAYLARKLEISEPSVKSSADKGRDLLFFDTVIRLYEDNAGQLFVHRDGDSLAWSLGIADVDIHGEFRDNVQEWVNGDWEPGPRHGQTAVSPTQLGTHSQTPQHIATWTFDKVDVVDDGNGRPAAGGSGRIFLGIKD